MLRGTFAWGWMLVFVGLTPAQAEADPAPGCVAAQEFLTPTEHLRAVSLDLTGRLPTLADLEAVEAAGALSNGVITAMMEDPEFPWQIVRLHHRLLWPYINHSNFYDRSLTQDWDTRLFYRRGGWPLVYGRGQEQMRCRDEPEPDPNNIQPVQNPDGTQQEGWTCVKPYFPIYGAPWLDSNDDCPLGEVKVCAYDAQEAVISPNNGLPCAPSAGNMDPACGCGADMRYCARYRQFHGDLLASYDRAVHWTIANDRPYYEMLSEAPLFVNGPLTYYYKYFAVDPPFSTAIIPDLDPIADADTWVPLPMGPDWSGVLTHIVYRVRFMSNRSRTDRYYNSFLCSPFQPPVGGLPPATDAAMQEPDLQKRPGCKYCHSTIEPVASYWGHWGEIQPRYLNSVDYPDYDPACHECALSNACAPRCVQQYITSSGIPATSPYLGQLNAYLFLDDEDVDNVLQGPKLLVKRTLLDGRLSSCAVRNFAVWLLGRPILPDEESWLDDLTGIFVESDHDVKTLVFAIVTSELYRRVR